MKTTANRLELLKAAKYAAAIAADVIIQLTGYTINNVSNVGDCGKTK